MRLDQYLVHIGLVSTRSKAKSLIEQGNVVVDGIVLSKPSYEMIEECSYRINIFDELPYVGRGGLKLEGALQKFGLSVHDMTCVDIGASTGGFTDCLLQNGAQRVYAVDVGKDQLASKLCRDSRVINLEKVNARYSLTKHIHELCQIVVSDVSFISQTYIIPNVAELLVDNGFYLFLVKPQFECGPSSLNKHGIVTKREDHVACIQTLVTCLQMNHLCPVQLTVSPILGGSGNREYLLLAQKNKCATLISDATILEVVFDA